MDASGSRNFMRRQRSSVTVPQLSQAITSQWCFDVSAAAISSQEPGVTFGRRRVERAVAGSVPLSHSRRIRDVVIVCVYSHIAAHPIYSVDIGHIRLVSSGWSMSALRRLCPLYPQWRTISGAKGNLTGAQKRASCAASAPTKPGDITQGLIVVRCGSVCPCRLILGYKPASASVCVHLPYKGFRRPNNSRQLVVVPLSSRGSMGPA